LVAEESLQFLLTRQVVNLPCELRRSFVVPIRSGLLRMTCLGCAPCLRNSNFRVRVYTAVPNARKPAPPAFDLLASYLQNREHTRGTPVLTCGGSVFPGVGGTSYYRPPIAECSTVR